MSEKSLPPYSVLMSVYAKDKPEYLDAAIASMTAQTVPFVDMVVVCDGPLTEGIDAVLDNWKWELDGRLTLHRLPKNGCVAAIPSLVWTPMTSLVQRGAESYSIR